MGLDGTEQTTGVIWQIKSAHCAAKRPRGVLNSGPVESKEKGFTMPGLNQWLNNEDNI